MTLRETIVRLAFVLAIASVVHPARVGPLAPTPAIAQASGGDRSLETLHIDLALTEARLNAVLRRLRAVTKDHNPGRGDSNSDQGLLSADNYVESLAEISTRLGRPLEFRPVPASSSDQADRDESASVSRESDAARLRERRDELEARRIALWGRLAWGAFVGRDISDIYKFNIDRSAPATIETIARRRAVEAGVRTRRTLAAALGDAAVMLDAEAENRRNGDGPTDVAAAAEFIAEHLDLHIKVLLGALDEIGGGEDADPAIGILRRNAEALRESLVNLAESEASAGRGVPVVHSRVQRDLRDTLEYAAAVDVHTASLAEVWVITADQNSLMPEVRLPRPTTRPTLPPRPRAEKPKRADPLAMWQPGSRWTTRNNAGGAVVWSVRSRDRDQIEIQRPSVSHGTVVVTLRVRDDRATVIRVRHDDGNRTSNRDWNGSGVIRPDRLQLTYSVWSRSGSRDWGRWQETIDLRPYE